jgi:hypothetical protein
MMQSEKINLQLKGKGGIFCLDELGNRVRDYTPNKVLELPKNLPSEVREEIIETLKKAGLLE